MNNAVIYARYSSSNQREESIEGQVKACMKYANDNDLTVLHSYEDREQSGRTTARPEFQQLLADSSKGQFDTVLVYQIDRWARNELDFLTSVNTLQESNIRLVSVTEPSANTPDGQFMRGILSLLAQYFSDDLSKKIRRGMDTNGEKNMFYGGAVALGYEINKETKRYVVDPKTAPIVQRVFKDVAKGKPIGDVIKELNSEGYTTRANTPFNKNSFYRLLRNRRYLGNFIYKGKETPGGIPQLIDEDTFNMVQKRLESTAHRRTSQKDYALTSKLFCGHCGAPMTGKSGTSATKKTYYYYVCRDSKKKQCKKAPINKTEIEELVLSACYSLLSDEIINQIADEIEVINNQDDSGQIHLKELKKRQEKLNKTIEILLDSLEDADCETKLVFERLRKRREELESIELEIAQLELKQCKLSRNEIIFFLTHLRSGKARTRTLDVALLNAFVKKIYLYDDKLEIHFNVADNSKTLGLTSSSANNVTCITSSTDEKLTPPKVPYSNFCKDMGVRVISDLLITRLRTAAISQLLQLNAIL